MTDHKVTLAARIAMIMGAIGGVEKKGKISSQGNGPTYKFARDSDVLLAVIPKLAADGIVMVPEHIDLLSVDLNLRGTQQIATVKAHWLVTDGVEELRFESLGMGQDSGDKSLPKAQTNARKYGLFMLLHIVTGDDPDQWSSDVEDTGPARSAPASAPSPRERLLKAASAHSVDAAGLERLAKRVGVPSGQHADDAQIEQIIALIETPEQASIPPSSAPATDPLLDAVLAQTGGTVEPEKPEYVRRAEQKAAAAKAAPKGARETPEPIGMGLEA